MTCPTKALAGCWKISPAAFSHRSDPQRTPRVRLGPYSLWPCWTAFLSSLLDCAHVALAVRTFSVRAYQHSFPQTARSVSGRCAV